MGSFDCSQISSVSNSPVLETVHPSPGTHRVSRHTHRFLWAQEERRSWLAWKVLRSTPGCGLLGAGIDPAVSRDQSLRGSRTAPGQLYSLFAFAQPVLVPPAPVPSPLQEANGALGVPFQACNGQWSVILSPATTGSCFIPLSSWSEGSPGGQPELLSAQLSACSHSFQSAAPSLPSLSTAQVV